MKDEYKATGSAQAALRQRSGSACITAGEKGGRKMRLYLDTNILLDATLPGWLYQPDVRLLLNRIASGTIVEAALNIHRNGMPFNRAFATC